MISRCAGRYLVLITKSSPKEKRERDWYAWTNGSAVLHARDAWTNGNAALHARRLPRDLAGQWQRLSAYVAQLAQEQLLLQLLIRVCFV